jgi:hypothetical protein
LQLLATGGWYAPHFFHEAVMVTLMISIAVTKVIIAVVITIVTVNDDVSTGCDHGILGTKRRRHNKWRGNCGRMPRSRRPY